MSIFKKNPVVNDEDVKNADVSGGAEKLELVQEPVPVEKKEAPFMHDPLILGLCFTAAAIGGGVMWFTKNSELFALQAAIFFGISVYASVVDFRTHLVSNWVHAVILGAALLGIIADPSTIHLISMGGGAILGFLPLFVQAVVTKKHRGMGGGDMMFMLSSGFMLGFWKIYWALIIGLLFAVIINGVRILMKKQDKNTPFACVPYLAFGCILTYFM